MCRYAAEPLVSGETLSAPFSDATGRLRQASSARPAAQLRCVWLDGGNAQGDFGPNAPISKSKPLVEIPPDVEAEMTPLVKAFVLSAFAKFEERISAIEEQVQKLTPRNSSLVRRDIGHFGQYLFRNIPTKQLRPQQKPRTG